jgi:hypothetical protein
VTTLFTSSIIFCSSALPVAKNGPDGDCLCNFVCSKAGLSKCGHLDMGSQVRVAILRRQLGPLRFLDLRALELFDAKGISGRLI